MALGERRTSRGGTISKSTHSMPEIKHIYILIQNPRKIHLSLREGPVRLNRSVKVVFVFAEISGVGQVYQNGVLLEVSFFHDFLHNFVPSHRPAPLQNIPDNFPGNARLVAPLL